MRVLGAGVKPLNWFFSTVDFQISLFASAFAHCIHRNLEITPDLKLTQVRGKFKVTFVDG